LDISKIDVCFLLDGTFSMENYIKGTKKRIKSMIKEIKETFNVRYINWGCVVYRDFKGESEDILEKQYEIF
jgi:hypothetical protein